MNEQKTTDDDSPTDNGHLPARSTQSTALLEAPKAGLKRAVERSAQVYYSTCRRLARLLNGSRD